MFLMSSQLRLKLCSDSNIFNQSVFYDEKHISVDFEQK